MPKDHRASVTVRVDRWGGFVWVCLDPDAPPLLEYLDPLPDAVGPVPPRPDADSVLPGDRASCQLEGRRRRLQRGLPRPGDASADPAVDRRRQPRLRAVGHPLPLRPPAQRAADIAPEPAPRARPRANTTKVRSWPSFVEGLGGLFYEDERALIDKVRSTPSDGETMLSRYQKGRRAVAGRAGGRRRGVRRRPADQCGRRVLLPQHGRADLSRAAPSSSGSAPTGSIRTAPSRTRGSSSGPATARSAKRVAAALLPGLDRARLGHHHEPGLRQHGARADRHEVARGARAAPQPPPGEQRPAHAPDDRPLPDRLVSEHGRSLPQGRHEPRGPRVQEDRSLGSRVIELAGLGPGPVLRHGAGRPGRRGHPARAGRDAAGAQPARSTAGWCSPGDAGHRRGPQAPAGRRAGARAWSEHADVLLEGFRPGVLERMGLGPDRLPASAIPAWSTDGSPGYGREGPLAAEAGHDINYISVAGALAPIGRRGEAPVPPLNLRGRLRGRGDAAGHGSARRRLRADAFGPGPGRRRRHGGRGGPADHDAPRDQGACRCGTTSVGPTRWTPVPTTTTCTRPPMVSSVRRRHGGPLLPHVHDRARLLRREHPPPGRPVPVGDPQAAGG